MSESNCRPRPPCSTHIQTCIALNVLPHSSAQNEISGNINKNTSTVNNDEYVFPAEDLSAKRSTQYAEGIELIYSSLPPELNIDIMTRATRTPFTGVKYIIKKTDGKLRINQYQEETANASRNHDKETLCIACTRTIGKDELYLNFPDDLDRRRLWGNALGFKYNEILRLKIATGYNITSIGHICTDHFSEECFRKYNFNKAAIECFGMPLTCSTSGPTTPVKKRTPWDCTICPYRCYSVFEMHTHLSSHAQAGKEDEKVRKALFDKGITCPFCRRCTYGYKTISGFQRHLLIEPTSHFYLKRIYEIAVKNCRSSSLEPLDQWSTWSESNVFYAYHGCEVPLTSPQKRSGDSPASCPSKKTKNEEHFGNNAHGIRSAARRLDLTCADPKSSLLMNKPYHKSKLGCEAKIEMSTTYVTRIKALLNPETFITTSESKEELIIGNSHNLAQALRLVTEEDETIETLYLDDDEMEPSQLLAKQRKTARQLESNEARLRIFGDMCDVPHGYKKVDGPDGPRLVSLEKKSWRERLTPEIQIRNRRFLPLN